VIKIAKLKSLTIALVALMSFCALSNADEVTLPVVSRPSALQEGIQRDLTEVEIAELLPWARDSRTSLAELLSGEELYSHQENLDRLITGVRAVLKDNSSKNAELLMRYILSRGLAINTILDKEMANTSVGSADVKLRVMKTTIQMAVSYYDMDEALLVKKTKQQLAIFGLEYYEFLTTLNKSIFDASAQYQIQKTALEWFLWDLYRDLNNTKYAPLIIKINSGLKLYPAKTVNDTDAVESIRKMKKMALKFDINIRGAKKKALEPFARTFSVDDQVLYEWNDVADEMVTVVDVYTQGQYSNTMGYYKIKFKNGKIKDFVPRSSLAATKGCTSLCAGDKILYFPDNYINAINTTGVIVGVKEHEFIIQHTNGKLKNTASKGILAAELALPTGCSSIDICVGDKFKKVIDGEEISFTIYGIQPFNKYVIQYINRDAEGSIEPRITAEFLASAVRD
jgi:hypothetical protein